MAWASPTSAPRASRPRGALRARRARHARAARPTGSAPICRDEVAGQGVSPATHHAPRARPCALRRHGHVARGARRSVLAGTATVLSSAHARAFPGGAPRALRLHRREQGARRRGHLGGGRRRRRRHRRAEARAVAPPPLPEPDERTRFYSQGRWHEAAVFTARAARARPRRARPRARHRAAPDRRRRGRLAGRAHRARTISC